VEDTRVARRYATALFNTAQKYEIVEAVEEELGSFERLLANDAQFRRFFIAPYASRVEKIEFVDRIFNDRMTALTLQLIKLMLEKGREREIQSVRSEFQRLRRENADILHVVITSATELDAATRGRLVTQLEKKLGKKIEPDFAIDPRLIGGVKAAYGSFVLDGTVRGALSRLQDALRHDVLKQA
jgi:F-type H+-transporting ATPase subunit delta